MAYRVFSGVFFAACILAGAANAAEVKHSVEVEGEPAAVWSKIGGWCGIADWHPAIAKCEESEKGGTMRRTLTTKDGAAIEETMLEKGDASYSYRIDESPLPVSNYTAKFAVQQAGGKTSVVWTARFDPKGKEDEAKAVIDGIFKAGLDGIASRNK
ncbi:MAG: SRPBCC family protein [Rhodomicrobium sp.]|nr:SRPBCC family protein [Rhodomicrobium sp.]